MCLICVSSHLAQNENCYLKSIHYPFEIIKMWQFIQILVSLSWILFTNNYIETDADGSDLASMFHSLIKIYLMPHVGTFCGKLVPSMSTYFKAEKNNISSKKCIYNHENTLQVMDYWIIVT